MKPRQWFTFTNAADTTVAEIHIIDIIGDWVDEMINEYWGMKATVTAKAFVDQLAALPSAVTTIRVHINSPGGDVFAALNIANALREQQTSKGRTVETIVDGLAASAASIIMMAGKTVRMADNAMVMVHNPWSVAVGNAAEMRKQADTLDAVRNTIVATYKWHSSLEYDALVALLDAETWMDADQAIEHGFATEKVEGLAAAATIDTRASALLKVPAQFKDRLASLLKPEEKPAEAPKPMAALEVVKACTAGGCLEIAESLIEAGATMAHVTARVTETKAAKAAEAARVDGITKACAVAKCPELAAAYIAGGMPLAEVKQQLTTITAKLDKVEIDANLPPNSTTKPKAAIDTAQVYRDLNRVH